MTRIIPIFVLVASLALAGCLPEGARSLTYTSDTRTAEQIAAEKGQAEASKPAKAGE